MARPVFHIALPRTPARRARAVAVVNAVFPLVIAALLAGAVADHVGGTDPVRIVAGTVR
jgi:hypothetical protein